MEEPEVINNELGEIHETEPVQPKRSRRVMFRYVGGFLGTLGVLGVAVLAGGGSIHGGLVSATIYEAANPTGELMPMPKEVRAIYITAQTAGKPSRIKELIAFAHAAGMNAAVVNVKDGTGIYLDGQMASIAKQLKDAGIYPIARIVAFQDNYLANAWPDLALQNADGSVWSSRGYLWLDPASREVWEYNVEAAIEALNEGFSEVNFDYIRFPADGDLNAIRYPVYDGKKTKREVINEYAAYVVDHIKHAYPNAVISADVFAQGLIAGNDQGIGQQFTDLAGYFDVIAPMSYPSHYAPGNFGFAKPAEAPYEVVKGTMDYGNKRLLAAHKKTIVRPWLQDFNMGAIYDRRMIQAQIKGVVDAGLPNGYMMWNPSNRYVLEKYQ